jgi:asparagine synthase (glutamine-hydrolysing)
MTAIAGIIRLDQNPVDRDTVDRMVNQLKIYGRDAQHTHFEQGAAFLRTLLRITPEDSLDRQPLVHPPTRTLLLFDGRLDNREELAEALGISKPDLKLMSDSDVALQACLKWDTETVDRLLGDFALACWNPRQRRLWLARDALGTRPLYWHKSSGFFAFATMPKGLFAIPGIQRAICEERLHDYLCLLPMIGPESFFKDVYRVEPGQFLVLDGSTVTTQKYHRWDPDRELRLASDDEYLEAFREQVDRAVACRLRSTGLVASHLSSGFDSSTVTAVAARLLAAQGKPLIAYTAVPREGFDGPVPKGKHGDEGPGARAVAARFNNVEHHLIPTPDVSLPTSLEKTIQEMDQPFLNPSNLLWVNAIRDDAGQKGCKVLLVGSSGNLSISYTGMEYLSMLIDKREWQTWWRELNALKKNQPHRRWRGLLLKSFSPFLPNPIWRLIRLSRGERNLDITECTALSVGFLERMSHEKRVAACNWNSSYRPWRNARRMRIDNLNRFDNGNYLMPAKSRSLVTVDPTADRRLIEFCLMLPEEQYLKNGQDRRILRRLMAETLPPEILGSSTRGYQAADWYETVEKALPRVRNDLEQIKTTSATTILDIASLEREINTWPASGYHSSKVSRSYQLKLLRGLSAGTFILQTDSDNR